jgi:hypothetical protein
MLSQANLTRCNLFARGRFLVFGTNDRMIGFIYEADPFRNRGRVLGTGVSKYMYET